MTHGSPACRDCGSRDPIGVQIRGVHDGVCYWECQRCGRRWNRFAKTDMRWSAVEKRLALLSEEP